MSKTYDTYKDSGISWIGYIPNNWKISKMKHIGTYINGYAFKPSDWNNEGKPIIRIQDLTGSQSNPNYYNGELDEKYLVKAGDILVSWAATLDAFIWSRKEGWLNQHIFKAIPNTNIVCKDFFFWLVKVAMSEMNNDNKHGIVMQHVTTGVFNIFKIPLPPLTEQEEISCVLNKKCSEIEELISVQEEMIKELQSFKISYITKIVTSGINKCSKQKDSNVDWIGMIPETWTVAKFKNLFRIKKDIAGELGYDVLSVTQKGIKIKDITKNEGQLAQDYSKYQLVAKEDFVMNHMDLLTGWVDISQYSGVTSPDYRVFVLLDEKNNHSKYYLYLMQMCYTNRIFYGLGQGVSGLGRWRLQADKFLNFTIPVPSYEEQKEIADYLDKKCAEIDTLIEKKTALLAEMESYKKSVIYEYVTGKKEETV